MTNKLFIGSSLDGYIADKDGGLDFLDTFPNPEQNDMGYGDFMKGIQAIVMGRVTFEKVLSFGIEWPYQIPVFLLSNSLMSIPEEYEGKVHLINGQLNDVIRQINNQGYHRLYIDGGKTIQSFLKEDLIDEMIITTIPVLLGKGIPLFGELPDQLVFECVETKMYLDKVVQSRFVRRR